MHIESCDLGSGLKATLKIVGTTCHLEITQGGRLASNTQLETGSLVDTVYDKLGKRDNVEQSYLLSTHWSYQPCHGGSIIKPISFSTRVTLD